jgi:hypothetical protein
MADNSKVKKSIPPPSLFSFSRQGGDRNPTKKGKIKNRMELLMREKPARWGFKKSHSQNQ